MASQKLTAEDFYIDMVSGNYKVMDIKEGELAIKFFCCYFDGARFSTPNINKMATVERGEHNSLAKVVWIKGFEIKKGAIASCVGHKSNNMLIIGADDISMAIAANHLLEVGGGFCVVKDGQVIADLKLPIDGLLSLKSSAEVNQRLTELKGAAKEIGITISEPFVQMNFLVL